MFDHYTRGDRRRDRPAGHRRAAASAAAAAAGHRAARRVVPLRRRAPVGAAGRRPVDPGGRSRSRWSGSTAPARAPWSSCCAGFYDPTRGRDPLGRRGPARARRRPSCAQRIGAVFQDYMSYDLTAAENIGAGRPDGAAHDRAARSRPPPARPASTTTVAALPRGYDTLLTRIFFGAGPRTTRGRRGALRRAVAAARAGPGAAARAERDLMILDEPSSGLDAEAEHEVHDALRAASRRPDQRAHLPPARRGPRRRPDRRARRRADRGAGRRTTS